MNIQLNIVIIEDERKAALELERQLKLLNSHLQVLTIQDSVAGAVTWFRQHEQPDLIFMDIHLGDGNCFEIFQQVKITSPVVFCTAYDAYALDAFKLSGIGYIVKPIDTAMLENALEKHRQLAQHYLPSQQAFMEVAKNMRRPQYRTSFLVPFRSKFIPLPASSAVCMYVRNEQTYLVTAEQEFMISKTLEQLQAELDPNDFYRANRQHLVSFSHIKEIIQLDGRKIGIILSAHHADPIVVSKENASDFKRWMERY